MARRKKHQCSALLDQILMDIPDTWDGLRELAEDSEVSLTTLYHWKVGYTTRPRLDTLEKVIRALGYELSVNKFPHRNLRLVK